MITGLRQWYGVDPADGSALYVASQEAIDANGGRHPSD